MKNFFKVQIKSNDGLPSVRQVTYVGADGEEHTGLEFEGYASTKHPDRGYDIVEPKAFHKTLSLFMENPQLWLQHDENKCVGSIIEANIDEEGLYVKAIAKVDVDNVFQKLRTGVIKTMSFQYSVKAKEQRTMDIEGKKVSCRVITELELYEVSLVSVPLNAKAKIKSMSDISDDLPDEEYKRLFDVEKQDDFPLYKSVEIALEKEEEEEVDNEPIETEEQPNEEVENEDKPSDEGKEELETEEKEKEEVEEEKSVEVKEILGAEEETIEDEEQAEKINHELYGSEYVKRIEIEQKAITKALTEIKSRASIMGETKATLDIETELKFIDVPEKYKAKVPTGALYFEGVCSDESVNRYDTIVRSAALKKEAKKFIKDGVILLSHKSNEPIGLPLWVEVDEGTKQVNVGGFIYDSYTEGRASKGLFKGLSIGFVPLEWVWQNKETEEELTHEEYMEKLFGADSFDEWYELLVSYRAVYTKIDWMEYSFCTTPANKGTSTKLSLLDENIREKYAKEIKGIQATELAGGNSATLPENGEVKGNSKIDLETQVKTLLEEISQLKNDLESKDGVIKDAGEIIEGLTKQIDEMEARINDQDELIDRAKKTWIKHGSQFVQKPKNDVQAKLEEIKARVSSH